MKEKRKRKTGRHGKDVLDVFDATLSLISAGANMNHF